MYFGDETEEILIVERFLMGYGRIGRHRKGSGADGQS